MTCGTYAITHIPSGQQYVGASQNIERRYESHINHLRTGTHHSERLQELWSQDGGARFALTVLEECSTAVLAETEARWTDLLQPTLRGGSEGAHGGSRFGAGRPQMFEQAAKRAVISLPSDSLQRLRELGDGSISIGVQRLLNEHPHTGG